MSCSRLSRRPPRPLGALRLLVLAAVLAGPGRPASAEDLGLRPGTPLEREIRAGEVQTYPVELAAGDFLRAVVEQQGADVEVRLESPGNQTLALIDSPGPDNDQGLEELAARVEAPGLYKILVRSTGPKEPPPDGPPPGYRIVLDPPRPAGPADLRRIEAVLANQEATNLMARRSPEDEQLVQRRAALEIWRELGDRRQEAGTLLQIGLILFNQRQAAESALLLHQAAAIRGSLGEMEQEARALNEAGRACEEAGQVEEALADYRLALARARAAGNLRQQADILNNLGLLLNRRGERQEALVHLAEGLTVTRKLGHNPGNLLNNLASAYRDLGETHQAVELYKQALTTPSHPGFHAAAYNNLGTIHIDLGNWDEAFESFQKAIAIVRRQEDLYRLASTLNNLGLVQHSSGKYEDARLSYEEALDLARKSGNRDCQILAANNLGLLLDQLLKRSAEAREHWREVVRLTAGHPLLGYVGLSAQAAVERGEKRLPEARETLRRAIEQAQGKAERRFAADLILRLARVEKDLGDLDAAAEHARTAMEEIESLRDRVPTPDQRALFLASSQSFYQFYIDILMDLHERRPGGRFDALALQVNERARARSLLDLLGEAETDLRRRVPPDLLERERRARATLRERDLYQMELIHQGASPERIAQAAERLSEAIDESEAVESALRASSESYSALTRPEPLSLADIQRQILGDRTLLLEYALGEERGYLWAVTPSTFQSFELRGRQEIERLALELYNATTARNELGATALEAAAAANAADTVADRAGRELSRLILEPVERLLGDRILLVVADGVLQYIPFAALPLPSDPGQRVLARNQVVSLPSASTLAVLRREVEGRTPAPKTLAVLADPVFPNDPRLARLTAPKPPQKPRLEKSAVTHRGLPPRGSVRQSDQLSLGRLPFSGQEAKDILSFVTDPGLRLGALGFAASYATATSGVLEQFRYVHFATHGLIDSRQPKLSKLALSQFDETGRPLDGFLRLSDIYNLDLNADLVVLSACETALGQEVRGEGLVGLTRGFMYAGAPRVLASFWSVEDRATAKLMKSFYRHLLAEKRPAADALQRAQLEMASKPQYRSPYFWAGFSLQGEWK